MRIITIFSFLLISTLASGQFNSKVGYTGSFISLDGLNNLFTAFDNNNPYLADNLKEVSLVHGLEIGMRYRKSNLSVELGITTGNANASATGINPNTGTKDDIRWKLSTFDYHLGVTQHISNFGITGAITRARMKVKEYNSITTDFVEISSEYQWGVKLSAQIEIPGAYTSFVIRPFYQFSLSDYDFAEAKDILAPDFSGSSSSPARMFGLSILFHNGPQRGY